MPVCSSSWRPSTGLPPVCQCLVLRNPKLYTKFQGLLDRGGIVTSLHLMAMLLLIQPRMLLAFFATVAHCRLQLLAREATQVVVCKMLSTQSVPSLYCCTTFFHPRCRPLHFHICHTYMYIFVYIFYFQLVLSWPIQLQNLLIYIFK